MMPNINTSVDILLMKTDRRFDFTTGSNKPIPLTADPVVTDPNISDDSEVCADSLSDTGKFETIKLKQNEMFKNFNSTFAKNDDDVLKSVSSPLKQRRGSKLNPKCEPFVPTGSLEQASTSNSSCHGDCDVKSLDPKQFHENVCCCACGRPSHIARICQHRPTEFFYGKNKKVTPYAKPTKRSMRTDQSSKPRVKPQKVP
ncbi:hypothetical protein R6Q57_016065 [Mikania cordata]